MNSHQHRRNLNVLVVGGSGAGKTRFMVKPNLMQLNCSYVLTDPKTELLYSTGEMFKKAGYKIKVINLIDMDASQCYNPFCYIKTETDVIRLIKNLMKSTTEKGASKGDPFWENSESALLQALIFFLLEKAPPEEQNFSMIAELLEFAKVDDEDSNEKTILDELFETLEIEKPDHIALKQYKIFKQAGGKTAMSILISAAVRLTPFNLPQIKRLTSSDDMELETYGDIKTVCYAVIPDNDTSLNFIISMLYTQLFQTLYFQADNVHKGRLPIHVRFIMDEFANISLPDDFEKVLATMRSREISCTIIVQAISQLKALFEKTWESITGNCDCFVYLGGNENFTHEYLSKALGKETIDTQTRGLTKGKSGSSSQNFQNSGRELLQLNEVRMLPNDESIIMIRGELPIIDQKYMLEKHPNIAYISDGGAPLYLDHTKPELIISTIQESQLQFNQIDNYGFFEEETSTEKEKRL